MKNQPQVIIDCQLLQSTDRHRGMGLFLNSLLRAFKDNPPDFSLKFIINSRLNNLTDTDRDLLQTLGDIVEAKLLTKKDKPLYADAHNQNRKVVDGLSLLKDNAKKTVFFIPALFSNDIYPVYPSKGTANLLLFHDIIPFLYQDQYFRDHEGEARKDYAQRWKEAYRTDLFVTNSQTTADDLTIYFGIDPSRILPILGAGAHNNVEPTKPKIDDLSKNYALMPSGDDHRKNNATAVRAFAEIARDIQLVITSNFSPESKRALKNIYPNVIFTGSVVDSELLWLMDNARLVFFPSEYEGLGMPILEAVSRGAPIVCSDIPVFREISEDAFSLFDPKSQNSISNAIKNALDTKTDKEALAKEYDEINKSFTWDNTAKRFCEAVNKVESAPEKLKLAIFCPSPSTYSAVGKYAFETHGELSRYFDIDYYYENGQSEFKITRPNILEYAANYYPASTFKERNIKYDRVLYHIGNSEFHTQTILTSLIQPANAIVHDSYLNGIFDYMERYHFLTKDRREIESVIDKKLAIKKSSCLTTIVTNQKTILCHSNYVKKSIEEIDSGLNIAMVSHPTGVPEIVPKHKDVTVSFAGIISESKGINLVRKVASIDDIKVKVFGYGVLGDSPLLNGLTGNVEVIKDLSDKDFQDNLRATDILINYRVDYHGETSRSALEAMRYGAVVVVRDVGWFSELPNGVVIKVKNELDLIAAVTDLSLNAGRRLSIGSKAREFLSNEYSYAKYAKSLKSSLRGKHENMV